jgi:hypothetical protein
VISSSPIEHLRIVCDDEYIGANVRFNSIIDHLVKKHSGSLRILDFRSAYIGADAVRALFTRCLRLEKFHISAGVKTLVSCFLRISKYAWVMGSRAYRLSSASVPQA